MLRIVVSLVIVLVVVFALTIGADQLPEGTATGTLVIRGMIGLFVGLIFTLIVRRMMRALGDAPAPPPRTVDAREADVVYECPVCGTRVRLEVAATAKAPKHCGEEMEARLG